MSLALGLPACSYPPLPAVAGDAGAGSDAGPPRQLVAELPVTVNRDIDVLFVVDDSPSMTDKQTSLITAFPSFVNVLSTLPGGLPNLHLGVITTDMGTQNSETMTPAPAIGVNGAGGCSGVGKNGVLQVNGAPLSGSFLSDIGQPDGTRQKNYTGTLSAAFATMAKVGAGGCGFEQPLAAVHAALTNSAANTGFLRPAASLAVVILTDEDDCSVHDPQLFQGSATQLGPLQSFRCTRFGVTCAVNGQTPDDMNAVGNKAQCDPSTNGAIIDDLRLHYGFLATLKARPDQVIIAGIMGPPSPVAVELDVPPGGGTAIPTLAHSCTFNGSQGIDVADPPVRLAALIDLFALHATESICQPDLAGQLINVGQTVATALGSPCLNAQLADADPSAPGTQLDCVVNDVVNGKATPIPNCASSAPTCWQIATDPTACGNLDHLKLVVTRSGTPDPAIVTQMRCTVAM